MKRKVRDTWRPPPELINDWLRQLAQEEKELMSLLPDLNEKKALLKLATLRRDVLRNWLIEQGVTIPASPWREQHITKEKTP